jgi:hypothetical protein
MRQAWDITLPSENGRGRWPRRGSVPAAASLPASQGFPWACVEGNDVFVTCQCLAARGCDRGGLLPQDNRRNR